MMLRFLRLLRLPWVRVTTRVTTRVTRAPAWPVSRTLPWMAHPGRRKQSGGAGDLGPGAYGAGGSGARAPAVRDVYLRRACKRAILPATRHRCLATLGSYVRIENAWAGNGVLGMNRQHSQRSIMRCMASG
jgi:hypothetical protein